MSDHLSDSRRTALAIPLVMLTLAMRDMPEFSQSESGLAFHRAVEQAVGTILPHSDSPCVTRAIKVVNDLKPLIMLPDETGGLALFNIAATLLMKMTDNAAFTCWKRFPTYVCLIELVSRMHPHPKTTNANDRRIDSASDVCLTFCRARGYFAG